MVPVYKTTNDAKTEAKQKVPRATKENNMSNDSRNHVFWIFLSIKICIFTERDQTMIFFFSVRWEPSVKQIVCRRLMQTAMALIRLCEFTG